MFRIDPKPLPTNPVEVHFVVDGISLFIEGNPTQDQLVTLKTLMACMLSGYSPKKFTVGLVQDGRTLLHAEKDSRHSDNFLLQCIYDQLNPTPEPEGDYPESEDDCL